MHDYPETVTFRPIATVPDGALQVPGSKSITNRALMIAALAVGESVLTGALDADDTRYMIDALRRLGVVITTEADDVLRVIGTSGRFAAPIEPLFIGNSGTTIRFLTAAACYASDGAQVRLDGIARMRQRPIGDLLEALCQLGVDAKSSHGNSCPPVVIRGGGLPGGRCRIKGTMSSQYLSALLMAAPLANRTVEIDVDGDLVSKPYVDLTTGIMRDFGAACENDTYKKLTVPAQQKYMGRVYPIEPDASNATYFLAAAALTGGRITVLGLGSASRQGDAGFYTVLSAMGCKIDLTLDSITVTGPKTLAPVDVDLTAMPDTAQTAAVLALFADGVSHIRGLRTLRVKETDRIEAIATELRKLGAKVESDDESWMITPPATPHQASIATYDDHRMAMSFAVAGLKIPGLIIEEPGCVAKTFPDFWDRWKKAFTNVEPTT